MAKYRVSHPGFYVFSVFSLAILLVLCGLLLSALLFQDFYNRKFREDITLLAELSRDVKDEDVADLIEAIGNLSEIKSSTVRFVSAEDALNEVYGDLGAEVSVDGLDNPFADMITFSVVSEAFEREKLDALAASLESDFPITQLHYPSEYFDNAFEILSSLRVYLTSFAVIALGLTAILIHHIMKLNVVAQRRQIKTMELVGAKPAFIRKPFIRLGLRMGVHAWAAAMVMTLLIGLRFLGPKGAFTWGLSVPGILGVIFLLVIALAVCGLSTRFAVSNSLKTTILKDG